MYNKARTHDRKQKPNYFQGIWATGGLYGSWAGQTTLVISLVESLAGASFQAGRWPSSDMNIQANVLLEIKFSFSFWSCNVL